MSSMSVILLVTNSNLDAARLLAAATDSGRRTPNSHLPQITHACTWQEQVDVFSALPDGSGMTPSFLNDPQADRDSFSSATLGRRTRFE